MSEQTTVVTNQRATYAREYHGGVDQRVNVGSLERLLSVIGGGALAFYGLRRSLGHLVLMLGGGMLVYRGLTGRCQVYKAIGVSTVSQESGPDVVLEATVTINKPAAEVYRFWRHLENHPRFMKHLEEVVSTGNARSHWVAKGPLHLPVKWDAEIVEERENALLSWRSLPGADVDNAGIVRFRELPNGRGTEVRLWLEYAPPGGTVGVALARLFKTLTLQQLKEDLRHCKQIIEAGETPTTAHQPSGRNAYR